MFIWGCGSPATYCQPAAPAGFIYYRSQEWALHSPSPTGFVYLEFSWMHALFVSSSIQFYLPVAVFFLLLFRVRVGKCPSLTLQWSVPQDSHCYKLSPLQDCWAWAITLAVSGQLVYLQFTWGSAPSPLSGSQGILPSLLHVFFFFSSCLFIIQFVFFLFPPWVGGQSVQAMLICPRVLCGSTACHLFAHLRICQSG
jgi:hypothetical protein